MTKPEFSLTVTHGSYSELQIVTCALKHPAYLHSLIIFNTILNYNIYCQGSNVH